MMRRTERKEALVLSTGSDRSENLLAEMLDSREIQSVLVAYVL